LIDTHVADAVREPGPWTRLSPRARRGAALVAGVLVVMFVLRTFVVQAVEVKGASMEPTFASGTWVVVDKLSPTSHANSGDVIVFEPPTGSGATHATLIKRVIATAGERVSMTGCAVSVGGVVLTEPYVFDEPTCGISDVAEFIVPAGAIYVLGDHRSNSLDSRSFGAIPVDSVHGGVIGHVWPL
jgi:signal peptidase I